MHRKELKWNAYDGCFLVSKKEKIVGSDVVVIT